MENVATFAPTMAPSVEPSLAPVVSEKWYDNLPLWQQTFIIGLPVAYLVGTYVLLRCVWPVPKQVVKKNPPVYGSVNTEAQNEAKRNTSLVEEGEVAGDYAENWMNTFDFVFLIIMIVFAAVLSILTWFFRPEIFSDKTFWIMQLPKLATMMIVSVIGGLICRYFCDVDAKGYIITNKSSSFKVNYTRKLQHFAAYMVPLVVKGGKDYGPLSLAWGDFFTLMGFFVLIKPIRESFKVFMLQFNSLDRPEDRPHTLKWIVGGNIIPGLFILLFFKWLFGPLANLTFIIVFITGIGDGLAEPVGITVGKHKYKSRGCFSSRSYTRSWEGSACVFMSGVIFPALQYASFANFTQLVLAMLILPPTMAYAEATAPHTMDTPVLMIGCGVILYLITYF